MIAIAAGRRRLLLAALLALVALGAATGAAVVVVRADRPAPTAAAPQRPPLLPPGASASPFTVTGADGSTVACPTGSEPTVMITEANFAPTLTDGSVMAKGRYHIRLRGTVDNETGAAIDVKRLFASVRYGFWPGAQVRVARTIAAQSSARITVDGTYTSKTKGTVRVATHLDWQWHDSGLTGCGENGLVADD
jgi:hypothetical protein